jgi:DnaJ family protein C protein 8
MGDVTDGRDDALNSALAQAEQFKNEGNSALKEKNYSEAIRLYTCALDLDPTNAVYLSNRSAAHLCNDSKTKALRDAEACIESKPDWWKGYIRKGAAEHALGRFDLAQSTYFRGLELDPGNASLTQAIEDVREAATKHSELLKKENAIKEAILKKNEEEEKAKQEEDALLASFMSEVEQLEDQANTVKKSEKPRRDKPPIDFGTTEAQMIRLLQPHYEWINLNPFQVLLLDTDATDEEIKQHYRKVHNAFYSLHITDACI